MEKEFELGLVLGRFNHMHKGHTYIIDLSRKMCEKTLILIGSAQEYGTLRNPFKLETRQKVIKKIYNNCDDVIIDSLNDMTNENDICFEWGEYILKNIKEKYGKIPDLMVYGKDETRKNWFSEQDNKKFSELIVERKKINISATELRKYLVNDDENNWKEYVPFEIFDMYDDLREELINLDCYR